MLRERGSGRFVGRIRARTALPDPALLVVGVVSLVVYALHGLDGKLARDEAVYAYAGQQFIDGVPPYEGVLNRAGPLAHMIPGIGAAGARLFDLEDLTGMRILFLLLTVACCCVTYLFARDLFDSRAAGLAAAFAFLTFEGFIDYASAGPREKTSAVLFLLCSLWAAYKHRWLASGVWLSLATLTLQIVFPAGLAAILVQALALDHGERIRALVRTAIGGLGVLALFVVYFAANGALELFLQGFLLINAEDTRATPFTDDVATNWRYLENGFGASLWVGIVGMATLLIATLLSLSAHYRAARSNAVAVAALGAATLASLIWMMREYDWWPDAMLVLATASFGVGGIAVEITGRLRQRWAAPVPVIAWTIVATVLATSYAVGSRDPVLTQQRASVNAKLHALPSATILSVNAPSALVISGKTNPIPYQMFFPGLNEYVDHTWPGGLAGLADWIGDDRPTLIAFHGAPPPRWIEGTVDRYYVRAGAAPDMVWYVDRSVGRSMVEKLRRQDQRLRAASRDT